MKKLLKNRRLDKKGGGCGVGGGGGGSKLFCQFSFRKACFHSTGILFFLFSLSSKYSCLL